MNTSLVKIMIAKLDECIIKKNKNRNNIFLRQLDLINTFRVINSIFLDLFFYIQRVKRRPFIF